MELYIHIPFCIKKCNYCDFLSFPILEKKGIVGKYIDSLCEELWSFSRLLSCREGKTISTIYIGGGTPSALDISVMEKLLKLIQEAFIFADDIEYSIECNPGTLDEEKLGLYKKYGINRLSLGLQSDDNKHLAELGRIHTYGRFLESYCMARNAGFDNINIDLMSAIPGQRLSDWKKTLESICMLKPEHISAYSLIIEEGTPLYQRYCKNPKELHLPGEEEEREIYHVTKEILGKYGYDRYEISNYSLAGKISRHNYGYWTGEEYYGAGLGASSYLSTDKYLGLSFVRFKNVTSLEEYIKLNTCNKYIDQGINQPIIKQIDQKNALDSICIRAGESKKNNSKLNENTSILKTYVSEKYTEVEFLDKEDLMSEFCILGLRTVKGLSKSLFRTKFGRDIELVFGEVIEKYVNMDFLQEKDDYISFTDAGFDVSNPILAEFL